MLRDWSQRYDLAVRQDREMALIDIGIEMFRWLDASGAAGAWLKAPGDRALEISVPGDGSDIETALLDAPWELLATEFGPLVADELRLFVVTRRIGRPASAPEPLHRELRMMFMAAAPIGHSELDFEAEEAAILRATQNAQRVQMVVEETGSLELLKERLASDEGPFEALHLSCHGGIDSKLGPALSFETDLGDEHPVTPGALIDALPRPLPSLVALSACRTAETVAVSEDRTPGPDKNAPAGMTILGASYARQLVTQVANVLAWDGSVLDQDATQFATHFYGELGLERDVPSAAALARRALWRLRSAQASAGRHWHLARIYLGPEGGGALCRARGTKRERRTESDRAFLDNLRGSVPVASRRAFVGRRRAIQTVLRLFRRPPPMFAGALVHGMGAIGKSSLAARIVSRTHLKPVVVFEHYAAVEVFDALTLALPPTLRDQARRNWRDAIGAQANALRDALDDLLHSGFRDEPILLIVDDLERILETPKPGDRCTPVKRDAQPMLAALIEAFAHAQSDSRLLLTSRYDIELHDHNGQNLADRLQRLHLLPMDVQQRQKQLRASWRLRGAPALDSQAQDLLDRALRVAAGNPGLQDTLSTPIFLREIAVAQRAIEQIEHYLAHGVPSSEISAQLQAGIDRDSAIVAFFRRLSFETYRNALTPAERQALSAAAFFDADVPIPTNALVAVAAELGVDAPETALTRLLGLGLLDDYGDWGEFRHVSANALARPLAAPIAPEQHNRLAASAFPALRRAWANARGEYNANPQAVMAARLALAARAEPSPLEAAVLAGTAWLARSLLRNDEALTLIQAALSLITEAASEYRFHSAFLSLGLECAMQAGAGPFADELLDLPTRSEQSSADAIGWDLRRAERYRQKGDLDLSLRLARAVHQTANEAGETRLGMIAAGAVADIFQARGELDEALRIRREEALPVYERLGDVRSRAVTMGKIADVFQARGELDEALRIRREEALPVYERLGDVRSRSVTLSRIAGALIARGGLTDGRIQEIYEALAESFAIAQKLGLRDGIGYVGMQLAQVLAIGGMRDEALAVLSDAENALRSLQHVQMLANVQQLRERISAMTINDRTPPNY